MYSEFGPDACKEKQNDTQDTYFDTLMHLRNAIQSERRKLLSQKVVLIWNDACSHKAHLIQTLMKDFHRENFKQLPYSPDLVPSDCHLFP